MKSGFWFAILIVVLVGACRTKHPQSSTIYEQDSKEIDVVLEQFDSKESIDSLLELGLYNLAFASIEKNKKVFDDGSKMQYGFIFAENGEFDKANSLTDAVKASKYHIDQLYFDLYCALKKEDHWLSKQLLDSLLKQTRNEKSAELLVNNMLYTAYYQHNIKNYEASIELNKKAIQFIMAKKINSRFLLQAYRRLGNDYNDIVRNNLPYSEPKDICLKKGLKYYQQELNLLNQSKSVSKTKIALNYITTAMLSSKHYAKPKLIELYTKALDELIVSKNKNFIVSRNPIYTSLALSNLGDIYLFMGDKQKMQHSYNMNKELIDIRSFYQIDQRQSLDLWEYFPQISEERKILFELMHNTDGMSCATRTLELSNNCKYVNQDLNKHLRSSFGSKAQIAIQNWLLLNELKVFGEQYEKNKISQFAEKCLAKYQSKIYSIVQHKRTRISPQVIDNLKKWCKLNEASIVDYQILYGGSIAMVIINAEDIRVEWINESKKLSRVMINEFLQSIQNNDLNQYQELASSLYKMLRLQNVKTKRIVICPDEFIEKIPFDALISENRSYQKWSKMNYLGKFKNIQLIPNLSSILEKISNKNPLKIDIWSSDTDNETLPYNQELINFLEQSFDVDYNERNASNILHILGHTYRSPQNNIEFRLNEDTLTIYSNGAISPKLAVLEGCSSGYGKIYKLEGSISQTRCFLYNETPSVISSIWDADNQSSTVLFKQFYKCLYKGESISVALNKAKKQLINDHTHPEWANPYYWANFQLTGQDLIFGQ